MSHTWPYNSWPYTHPLRFDKARCICKTYSAGALPFQNVSVDFVAKMFQHRLDRRRKNLTETAEEGKRHSWDRVVKQSQIRTILCFRHRSLAPTGQQINHFLRTDAAWHALAARLIAIETHGDEGHVQHASGVVTDYDGAGTQHGARISKSLKIQPRVDHRSGQVTRRGT